MEKMAVAYTSDDEKSGDSSFVPEAKYSLRMITNQYQALNRNNHGQFQLGQYVTRWPLGILKTRIDKESVTACLMALLVLFNSHVARTGNTQHIVNLVRAVSR
jgi:hypothetical protein